MNNSNYTLKKKTRHEAVKRYSERSDPEIVLWVQGKVSII